MPGNIVHVLIPEAMAGDVVIQQSPGPNAPIRPPAGSWRAYVGAYAGPITVEPLSATIVTAVFLGQSEIEYILNAGSPYRQIGQPTPGNGNLIVWTQFGDDVPPVRTTVNPATVAAGQVNPAMAALSAFLDFAAPGITFHVGDGAVAGTGRGALVSDAASGRKWSDLVSVVDGIEAETGEPLDAMIECWYNSNHAAIPNFGPTFWPMYAGQRWNGSSFTLGATNPDASGSMASVVFDHTFWDAEAQADEKGRGVFARDDTSWHILTPMPFNDGPVAPAAEAAHFSAGVSRLVQPARQAMHDLVANDFAQSIDLVVGPSAHLSHFGNGIHPRTDDPDGQIQFMWPFAVAMLRAAGQAVHEPGIIDVDAAENGAWADLVVDLPNGGTLTTLRQFRQAAAPDPLPPHWQPVVGVEVQRFNGGGTRPVFRAAETAYPEAFRGTVAIVDSGTGEAPGRTARVRITPEQPFQPGDLVAYLRGQATAKLLNPRDTNAKLMLDMLIEHVPALHDPAALYPFEGVAVRPAQAFLALPIEGGDEGLYDFTNAPLTLGTGNSAVPIMDGAVQIGWEWTVTAGATRNMSWDMEDFPDVLPFGVSRVFAFTLETSNTGPTHFARSAANTGLTTIRGLNETLAINASDTPQDFSLSFTPGSDARYLGIRLVNPPSGSHVIRITNPRITAG